MVDSMDKPKSKRASYRRAYGSMAGKRVYECGDCGHRNMYRDKDFYRRTGTPYCSECGCKFLMLVSKKGLKEKRERNAAVQNVKSTSLVRPGMSDRHRNNQ